ncbi:GIY-YIG nuclease family protein [Streptomyces sp. NBC_00842]|uniref:GIY-YIG nuclease family protein n=1 Tax=Streptomyces sp. NBC_00842 TaxID=2975848 RepID=UPI0038696F2C|nr:GIY-YIG nuclease family protein [Streptomyces sp. NBC_00842]
MAEAMTWRKRSRKSKRWVYLIGSPVSRAVKIGVSNDPDARRADLQVGSPVPLMVLWKTRGGQALESALHDYFAPYRTQGEWFDFGDESPTALVATAAVLMGHRAQPEKVPAAARYRYSDCTSCAAASVREASLRRGASETLPSARAKQVPVVPEPRKESGVDRVLRVISEVPMRQKDIVEAAEMNKGTVSKAISRLIAAGTVKRLDDSRVVLVMDGATSKRDEVVV